MAQFRSFKEILAEALEDPETAADWERTSAAQAFSIFLIQYRTDRKLSQAKLAEILGWRQPSVARAEEGEHEPKLSTLAHVAARLDADVSITIRSGKTLVKFTPAWVSVGQFPSGEHSA